MYKTKLQELCQRYSVTLPEYTTVRDGPDHNVRYTATVTLNGIPFQSPPNQCRSTKEAQNLAARFAFEYFSANPSVLHSPQLSPQPSATRASTPAPVHVPAAPAFQPPQLQQISREAIAAPGRLAAPQSVLPNQLQRTQIHNPSPPPPPPPRPNNSTGETISSASARLAGPQPVRPPLFQQTQIHQPSSPRKNSTDASTSNSKVRQSQESNAQTSEVNVTQLSSEEDASARGMYKSKLQELCHKHSWNKPEYTTAKEGPDHNPQFTATVIVNGLSFITPNNHCHSSKEATNLAARIAFDHLTTNKPIVPQQRHFPSTALSLSGLGKEQCNRAPAVNVNPLGSNENGHTKNEKADKSNEQSAPTSEFSSRPLVYREIYKLNHLNAIGPLHHHPSQQQHNPNPSLISKSSDMQYMYKNQLQQYAQKQSIAFPEYSCEIEGPPHAPSFRSKVAFGGKIFQSQEFFATLKEAEQAAAKVALEALSPKEIQKGGGLYKTLLQQLAQKQGCLFPVYKTIQSGPPHDPTFMATVEVGDETFQGQEAKSKKQAEMNAAEVAYNARMKCTDIGSKRQKTSTTPGMHSHIQPSPDNKSSAPTPLEHSTKSPASTPLERSTNSALGSDLESSAKSNVKETEKIVVSQRNSDVAVSGHASSLPSTKDLPNNQSSTPLKLEHLTNSIEEFDRMRPAVRDVVLVYPRGLEEVLPDHASISPYSDNKWVAVEVELKRTQI